jgi:hypothetical protein
LRRLHGWPTIDTDERGFDHGHVRCREIHDRPGTCPPGLASLDADGDPLLARSVDSDGNVVEDPSVPDFAWLARHSWAWDPARLDVLIGTVAPATLYVCGGAANELELADRFTQMLLLEIDEPTMLARLDAPSRDNEWGRIGDTREHLRRRLPASRWSRGS